MASRFGDANSWWFTLVVIAMALVSIWMIGWETEVYREDVAASHGRGLRGTFTVTHLDCGRSCTATGDFVSDNGRTVVRGVGLQEVDAREEGATYRVQYFAEPNRVTYPLHPSPAIWGLMFAVAGAAYLLALVMSLLLRPGRRFWALMWS